MTTRCSCGIRHERPRYQAFRPEPAEEWGPLKIAATVVIGLGFVYAIVTIGAVAA